MKKVLKRIPAGVWESSFQFELEVIGIKERYRGKYRISYGLQYDAWELAVQLPDWEEYGTKEEADKKSENRMVSALLAADAIFLLYEGTVQKNLPEQQERYQFSYLCEEAYERLGPPLSPEDIDKLIEKGRLEEVIFSPRYMLTEDDYVEFHGDLSEVYKELAKRRKPRYRLPEHLAGRETVLGYLFESIWYQTELLGEVVHGS